MKQLEIQQSTGYQKGQEKQKKIAGALGTLFGTMTPETEDSNQFWKNISLSRDMEYVRLIARQIELLNKKEELVTELAEFKVTECRCGERNSTAKIMVIVEENTGLQAEQKNKAELLLDEKLRQKQIAEELKRLDEEMAFLQKNLEAMFPESRRMQCMIYPAFREGHLLLAGVIKGYGTSYEGSEELCALAKPQTPGEHAQLIKANRLLNEQWQEILNIEVYAEAVCVVYPDGSAKFY